MKSNQRLLKIIQYLRYNPKTSVKEIAHNSNLSEAVVRYEVDNLNDYLQILNVPEVIRSSDGVVISSINDHDDILERISSIYKYSPRERQEYITLKLLLEGQINITKLGETLDVSRNTIKSDLREITEVLEQSNIFLSERELINTTEENIRKFLFNNFKSDYLVISDQSDDMPISDISELIVESFKGYNINVIDEFVCHVISETDSKQLFDTFYLYTIITIQRIINSNLIESSIEDVSQNDEECLESIKKHIHLIEKEFRVEFSSHELMRLANVLVTFNRNDFWTIGDEGSIKINFFVSELITSIAKKLDVDFRNDEILLEGLLLHTQATLYRMRNGFQIGDQMYYQAVKEHEELFDIVRDAINSSELVEEGRVSNEEITLFVVHFLGAMRRAEEAEVDIKKVVLLCNSGYGTSVLLRNILEANYQVTVVESISLYQASSFDYEEVDVLISTIDLDYKIRSGIPIPVIYISPFLNFEDTAILSKINIKRKQTSPKVNVNELLSIVAENAVVLDEKKLAKDINDYVSNKYVTHKESISLFDYISPSDVYIINKDISWIDMINIGGKSLESKGVIEKTYIDEIFSIVEKHGPYFVVKNKIAIPHASIDSGVKESGMTIVYSPNVIEFPENKEVNLMFFIASKDSSELISTMNKITKISENEKLYDEILNLDRNKLLEYFGK